MTKTFAHERLKVYNDAIQFCAWAGDVIEALPAKLAAKDQLGRASNPAEGNGKRSGAARCRFFDIARGSTLESAARLDVLAARKKLSREQAEEGKTMLVEIVSRTAGLIGRFPGESGEKEKD
jgi:S23 ribosomal protein.